MPDPALITPNNAVMPIVRIAVLSTADSGGRLTELALPAELPLREILPAVWRIVSPADETGDAAELLSLAPIGGAPFSLEATLNTVGVVDGDLLALQPVPVGPPAPRIVEDIADAAMIFSVARERPWGAAHIQRAATLAVVGLILVATALAIVHRVVTGAPVGLFAATALGVLLAAAAASLWALSSLGVGCGLILVAVLITVQAAQLSALCARCPFR